MAHPSPDQVIRTPPRRAPLAVVEERFGAEVIGELRRRGARGDGDRAVSLGRGSAVKREGGQPVAAANPDGMQGYACGG